MLDQFIFQEKKGRISPLLISPREGLVVCSMQRLCYNLIRVEASIVQ